MTMLSNIWPYLTPVTVTPLLLVIYLLITDFIDLYPYNDVKKHTKKVRFFEFLFNYSGPIYAVNCYLQGDKLTNLVIASVFVIGNAYAWWIPYVFGCSKPRKQRYQEKFGATITILPPIKDNPIPNLEHLPVTALIWIWFAASIMVF